MSMTLYQSVASWQGSRGNCPFLKY